MVITADGMKYREVREELVPVHIADSYGVLRAEYLQKANPACVSFETEGWTVFQKPGSYVVLDYGRELCGGIRIITRQAQGTGRWRLTFGESLTEACSALGEKNATNDHAPRDFEVITGMMSDLEYGQTGFRFVRLELLEGAPAAVQNIFAVSTLPDFPAEASIRTDDEELNEIIRTAAYTLKLNFQKGYIWDGIKRDRLVWCGDLNPEILTSLYLFGDTENIRNSLTFLKNSTKAEAWINGIPAYSAWWVINLCDYYRMTGNQAFLEEHKAYARAVIRHFDGCIREDGTMSLHEGCGMGYFLDWSTFENQKESVIGTAALICLMAKKYSRIEAMAECDRILKCLSGYLNAHSTMKPVRAFQILAGRAQGDDAQMLEKDGAKGFSTFMAYYILTAMSLSKSSQMLPTLKTYYGAMLSRGATSFWEDFDMDWLENSGRIDAMPAVGQKDIHGDYGRFCYEKFRHSLCHGWSAGVLAFIVEYIVGVQIENGGKTVRIQPHLSGLHNIEVSIPVSGGMLRMNAREGKITVCAPEGLTVQVQEG